MHGEWYSPARETAKSSILFAMSFSSRHATNARVAAAAVFLSIARPSLAAAQATDRGTLAISHTTVIDVVSGRRLSDRTVIVRDGRIISVGAAAAPSGAQIVDGRGKFLIPGLWDMHTHLGNDGVATNIYFPLQIANGVTGIREMTSDCSARPGCERAMTVDTVRAWQRGIAAGRIVGPRIITSSPMLDGPTPTWAYAVPLTNAADGRAAVHTFQARGVDFLKIYSLMPRDAFFALAAEARQAHIPFAGHVPIDVSALEASNAGMASMEHGHGLQEACSSRDSTLRAEQRRLIDQLIAAKEHNLLVEPIYVEQAERAFGTYDEARCRALYAAFVRNHTAQTPTLALLDSWAHEHDPRRLRDPRYRYIPELIRNAWEAFADAPQADVPNSRAIRSERLQWIQGAIGEMQRAGVTILAGTEEGGASFIYPGFAIHDELQLLVGSGLTPLQALQAATINPARFLHATDSLGSVAAGKRADLVLLDADPLLDIANTKSIRAVIADGRLFDRARLDFMLQRVEAIAAR
jgi:hypothetical protein